MQVMNSIILSEDTGGKGRQFRARFLQAGLVKYSFGVCLLTKETINKFVNTFVGCPVIIDHSDVTDDNAKDKRVGVISRVEFNDNDGWFWCEGILFDDKAIELINNGYNVSCQYEITEYAENTESKLHNGIPYDKVILNGKFEHLAIVDNPRYEGAMIAVNALAHNAEFKESEHPRDNEGKFTSGGDSKEADLELFKQGKIKGYEIRQKYPEFTVEELEKIQKERTKKEKTNREVNYEGKKTKLSDLVEKHGYRTKKQGFRYVLYKDDKFYKITPDEYNALKNVSKKLNTVKKEVVYRIKKADKYGYGQYGLYKNGELITHSDDIIQLKGIKEDIAKNNIDITPILDYIENYDERDDTMNEETKNVFERLIGALKAKNEADKKADNEDVDKRDIIRQIMAIAGKDEASEDVKTIAKLAEKLAYDKSEAGTADNKAENEEDKEDDKKEDKAENEEDKEDDKKEDKADNKCAKNEDVDKRKLIDEVGGILKGKVDDEVIRTIIEKLEEVAYDKSEAGTADNKAKNDDDEYKKLEEVVEKKAGNKAKNSMDSLKDLFFTGEVKSEKTYKTQAERIALGKKLF